MSIQYRREPELNRCPVCQREVRIKSSMPFGDAPCPNCGCLLWFIGLPSQDRLLFEYEASEAIRDRVMEALADFLGVTKQKLESDPSLLLDQRIDSLDMVELMMELGEEFRTQE